MKIQYEPGDEWIDKERMNKAMKAALNQEKKLWLLALNRTALVDECVPEDDWEKIIEGIMAANHLWQK